MQEYDDIVDGYFIEIKNEIIELILEIQNREAKINLPLEEQPDLKDIQSS